ncbi:PREDICTED: guanine nucleotide exchange factor DBS-like [Rhagoletis zephyria]|uniref:guanine nucleotide exchange factor DBS-like n=1 Tax=Rhagoletis zephyria TaxID=28612 RepID=UPI00081130C7|nr:PREDICTED: guanine nucleotide exchange factor DBS-like [Rhagoletis zephyria]
MENSPSNSIEKQIDNFLEHFKRSASKAMEADWCGSGSGSASGSSNASGGLAAGLGLGGANGGGGGADGLCSSIFSGVTANGSAVNQSPLHQPQHQPLQHSLLQRTKSRSSCLDISDLSDNDVESVLAESQAIVMSASQQRQQQLINQHMLESQTSVSSGASIQTVLHQSMFASATSTTSTQQQNLQRTGSISSNNTTPAHRAATPTKTATQQQSAAVNSNSNALANSSNSTSTAQSVSYATEALITLRPQQIQQTQQQLPPAECINSLLEHISPAAAAAAMSGEGVLNIADVADLLHPQHAIITGGRSHGGCPLIIFPDNNNFHLLEEADYQKLILYLTSVPSLQDTDLGFQLIIDRRKDKWTSVKTALQRISIYFPGIIHVVYVLRPSGLFQKAISEVSTKFSKDEYRFRLVICSALSDLHEYIDKSQLTVDMGGTLIYSHHEWIQQRISLEKFSSLTHQVSTELDIFIQTIHDTEFPNSVEATQKLIDVQGSDYERLKEEILAAARHGETLLNNIKGNEEIKEFSERTGNVSAIERPSAGNSASNRPPHQIIYHQQYKFKKPQHFDDCRDYRRLLVQLEETERRFDEFWRTHRNRLQQCLELRRFEQDFRELQTIFDAHLKCVAEMTEIGESVERVDTLMADTKHYQQLSQVDIERAGEVISAGQQLLGVRGVYPWEIVQPKCDELQRVCDIITERLCKRLEILTKNRELMERVEKANQWCANGVELLASQRIEKCSASPEIAEQSLQEIQAFISSAAEFKLSSPSEFKKIFLESTTPETKALVSQLHPSVLYISVSL